MFPLEIQPKANVRFVKIARTVLRIWVQDYALYHLLKYHAQHSYSKLDDDKKTRLLLKRKDHCKSHYTHFTLIAEFW